MPINPNIALGFQAPQQANPLDALANVLRIKGAMAQQQLIPGQLQAQSLENQTRQQQLSGVEAQNDAYKSAITVGPDGIPTIDKGAITSTLASKGQGHLIPGVLKQFTDMEESAGKVREQKSKMAAEENDYAGTVGAAAKAANYDPDILKTGLAHAAAIYGPDSPSAKALQVLQQDPSKAQAFADQLIKSSPKQQQLGTAAVTAEARKTAAETGAAKLPGELALQKPQLEKATAEATLATAKAKLLQNPGGYAAIVDTLNFPPDLADRTKKAMTGLLANGQLDQANKVLDQAFETANAPGKAAAVAKAEMPAKIATEAAMLPMRTQAAVNTEIAKSKLAPGYVAEIQNPAMQAKAITDWTKTNDEYQTKVGDASRLQQFVEAARSGNQAAAAMIPIAEVREIVNRVNQQELRAAGGGLSIARRVENWISTGAQGRPSSETLNDIEALGKMMQGAAKVTYGGKVAGLNALGAKFPKEPPQIEGGATPAPAAASGGLQVGQVVKLKSGKSVKVTAVHPDGTFDAQ